MHQFDPIHGEPPPPVIASLRRTCERLTDAFLAKYPGPFYVSHAAIYAGTDLLISSMMNLPLDVGRGLPVALQAIDSILIGTEVLRLQPAQTDVSKWVFLPKHTERRLIWADKDYPALRMTVSDDNGAGP